MIVQETRCPAEIHPQESFKKKCYENSYIVFTQVISFLWSSNCCSQVETPAPDSTTLDNIIADVGTVFPAVETDEFRPSTNKINTYVVDIHQQNQPLQTVTFLLPRIDKRGLHRKRLCARHPLL